MTSITTAFRPSINGFEFNNSYSSEEIMAELSSIPSWLMWDDTWGLCGGMCFAALDRYFQREPVPITSTRPSRGDPLFSELVDRQMDTVRSVGWSKILDYQLRPDEGAWYEVQHSLGYLTQSNHWPSVNAKLNAGMPTTICLIRAGRISAQKIGDNHQVVVWGYSYDSTTHKLVLRVYDPNYPNRDDIKIGLTLGQKNNRLDAYQSTGQNLRGFLHVPYDRLERYISPEAAAVAYIEEDNLEWLWTVLS